MAKLSYNQMCIFSSGLDLKKRLHSDERLDLALAGWSQGLADVNHVSFVL